MIDGWCRPHLWFMYCVRLLLFSSYWAVILSPGVNLRLLFTEELNMGKDEWAYHAVCQGIKQCWKCTEDGASTIAPIYAQIFPPQPFDEILAHNNSQCGVISVMWSTCLVDVRSALQVAVQGASYLQVFLLHDDYTQLWFSFELVKDFNDCAAQEVMCLIFEAAGWLEWTDPLHKTDYS